MTLLGVIASGAQCDAEPTDPAPADAQQFSRETSKFFSAYCADCHSGDAAEAGVDLGGEFALEEARPADPNAKRLVRAERGVWEW